jgi:hypothetical protein
MPFDVFWPSGFGATAESNIWKTEFEILVIELFNASTPR